MKTERGSAGNLLITGFYMLAMIVVMFAFLGDIRLMYQKSSIDRTARKYMLRMETTGELTDADRIALTRELEAEGVTGLSLEGTTLGRVPYGSPIVLVIRGKLEGKYDFQEKRVSTAKN